MIGQNKEFTELVKPLIKFLCDNYHPHVTIIVTPTGAELMEWLKSTWQITEFLRD